jgi:hypothetical protein
MPTSTYGRPGDPTFMGNKTMLEKTVKDYYARRKGKENPEKCRSYFRHS